MGKSREPVLHSKAGVIPLSWVASYGLARSAEEVDSRALRIPAQGAGIVIEGAVGTPDNGLVADLVSKSEARGDIPEVRLDIGPALATVRTIAIKLQRASETIHRRIRQSGIEE